MSKPSRAQLAKLHVLWSHLADRNGFDKKDRAIRTVWSVAQLNTVEHPITRTIQSYNDLTSGEAGRLIEILASHVPEHVATNSKRRRMKRSKRPGAVAIERARAAPSAASLALITELLLDLSVATREQRDHQWLDRWLATGRSAPARRLATQRDADRIIPALRNMVRRAKARTAPFDSAQGREVAEGTEVHA